MSKNATLLNMIATLHAMNHAEKKEAWTCECLACKFTKEYKLQEADATFADALLKTMQEQGFITRIPEPVS